MDTSIQKSTQAQQDFTDSFENSLILHNDNYNEFNFVVETLMIVCEHHFEQAYQCALTAHYKGKCEIKKGTFQELHLLKTAITEKGISATIE